MKKTCRNCIFLVQERKHKYGDWICNRHKDNARVTHPDTQFCGDQFWQSINSILRDKKLEELGI